jgi:hypothetical protein
MSALLVAVQVVVSGTVTYEDRDYTPSGFTGLVTPRPIRRAEVDIIDGAGALLGSGLTDDTGTFSIGGIPVSTTIRARVYARRSDGQINVAVLNNPTLNAVYAGITPSIDSGPGPASAFGVVLFTIAGGAAPAFNIFDCAVKSFEVQAGVDSDLPGTPPPLRLFWQAGSANGTYYSSGQNAVFLLGLTSDPDEFDDDIILHEIGHWVLDVFSRDDTLGGPHSITDQLDPRTSWSEGWAHYWSSIVRRQFPGEYIAPHTQVDNFGTGFSVFNLETPSFATQTTMATNELAVAAILWDITDATNEPGFDQLTGNELEVWLAVDEQMPGLFYLTLEDFREGLEAVAAPLMPFVTGSEADLRIMNAREVRYYPDGSEPNGALDPATILPPGSPGLLRRTIFVSGDEDWYSVDIAPGLVLVAETLNLGDGGNTFLEVYAPDRTTLLASNDNRGPGDLSSRVQTLVTAPGPYYLKVRRSGDVIENGYYDIEANGMVYVPPPPSQEVGYCSAATVAGGVPGAGVLAAFLLAWIACSRRR